MPRSPGSLRGASRGRVAGVRLALWAGVLAVTVFAGCAALAEKERELIFRPTRGEWRGTSGAPANAHELWLEVGPKRERMHAWWAPAQAADAPALLYLHGARWNLSGIASRIMRWNAQGFSVLAIDYRGFGRSQGDLPSEDSSYEDAQVAWAHLKRLEPDPARRFVYGHSLGGAIAIELARRSPDMAGLILEGTFTSISEMVGQSSFGWLPAEAILTTRFDSIAKIGSIPVPVLFVHGTADRIVPYQMSERLYAAAPGPKRLLLVPDGGHSNIGWFAPERYRAAVADFLALARSATRVASTPLSR